MKKDKFHISSLLSAVVVFLFLLSGAVVLVLFFRPLYYFEIEHLNLPAVSGIGAEEIRANYDTLIDYLFAFNRTALQFPTLPMSEGGAIHFAEVKGIFAGFQYLLLASAGISVLCIIYQVKKSRFQFLWMTSVITIGLPLILGAFIAVNWSAVFTLFHELVFDNDYWIFNASTDPVIRILPTEFFMHCAIMILAILLSASAFLFLLYRVLRKRQKKSA